MLGLLLPFLRTLSPATLWLAMDPYPSRNPPVDGAASPPPQVILRRTQVAPNPAARARSPTRPRLLSRRGEGDLYVALWAQTDNPGARITITMQHCLHIPRHQNRSCSGNCARGLSHPELQPTTTR